MPTNSIALAVSCANAAVATTTTTGSSDSAQLLLQQPIGPVTMLDTIHSQHPRENDGLRNEIISLKKNWLAPHMPNLEGLMKTRVVSWLANIPHSAPNWSNPMLQGVLEMDT